MIKTLAYIFLSSTMLTACANQSENKNNRQTISSSPLHEGVVQLVKKNPDTSLENQTVRLKILWKMSNNKARSQQTYLPASALKKFIDEDNRFIQILVPETPFSIIISNKASSAMIWDKERAILWQVNGHPLNGNPQGSSQRSKNYDFWYFQPSKQKISIFFGDDAYGYKFHFDFSDKNHGLKFYTENWTGF